MKQIVCTNQFCAHWHSTGCDCASIAIDFQGRCIDYLPIHLPEAQLEAARRQTRTQYMHLLKHLHLP